MSRKILHRRPEAGEISLASSPCQLRGTLGFGVVLHGLGFLCSSILAGSSSGRDDATRFLKLGKPSGCTVSTMVLSEARGLLLFRVVRGGIGFTQRLGASGTVCLQALGILTLEPERLKNRPATTREISGDGRGSSPETLKRLAVSVFQGRSLLLSSTESA